MGINDVKSDDVFLDALDKLNALIIDAYKKKFEKDALYNV
jgi:hypothetical protein